MSIENNLKRIADAQERIATAAEELVRTIQQTINPVISVNPAPSAAPAPSVQTTSQAEATPPPGAVEHINNPAPAPAHAPTPAPATAPATATAPMTPEQLNAVLVQEFQRLGDRGPIDNALKEMGVNGVTELPADRYQELLTKVQAIQA